MLGSTSKSTPSHARYVGYTLGYCFLRGRSDALWRQSSIEPPSSSPLPHRLCNVSMYVFLSRSLSFSYGRALQQSTLKAWQGKAENLGAAQAQLKARAQANSEANLGKYVAGSQPSADETLFVKGYKY